MCICGLLKKFLHIFLSFGENNKILCKHNKRIAIFKKSANEREKGMDEWMGKEKKWRPSPMTNKCNKNKYKRYELKMFKMLRLWWRVRDRKRESVKESKEREEMKINQTQQSKNNCKWETCKQCYQMVSLVSHMVKYWRNF